MREIDEIFIPLKKSHSGNTQQNMDDVVILVVSSSRSDPIQAPQRAAPLSDAHVRHREVSSLLGPTSMVGRYIGSVARRRGAYGGEFLWQGFAYAQS
jgi:hypothetical protein